MELIVDNEELNNLLRLKRAGHITAEQLARLDELLHERGEAIDRHYQESTREVA